MNKKLLIAIIALILLVSVIVFAGLWKNKTEMPAEKSSAPAPAKKIQESQGVPATGESNSSATADLDLKVVEDDLNSIDDEDFGEAGLSDAEVGL